MSGDTSIAWFDTAQDPENMSPDRAALKAELATFGIDIDYFYQWDPALLQADLLVLGDTLPLEVLPSDHKVLGLRTLNRRTRLDVLSKAGLPVQPYGAPDDNHGLQTLLSGWGTEHGIVKLDWSLRRAGVAPLSALPMGFDPSCDVVMKPLEGDDPRTLKVDIFRGHFLGASWLDTRAIGTPNWQMIGRRGQWQATLSPEDQALWIKASRALMPYGVGVASLDVMIGPDGPVIIEANTTGVGSAFWRTAPHPYADRLAAALNDTLGRLENVPPVADLAEMTRTGGNDYEAIQPDQSPGSFLLPDDIHAQLDGMMREADSLPEEARIAIGEQVEADLQDHAKATVPAYLADPGAIQRIIPRSTYWSRAFDFSSRRWPDGHGMVAQIPTTDMAHGKAGLTTHFAAAFEAALHRRALRWVGVHDPGQERLLIDRVGLGQGGLGYDSPPEEILLALENCGPVSLFTHPETALGLADAIAEGRAPKPEFRGFVITGRPLARAERQRITKATGAKLVEVLFLPPAGTLAIRCPDLGLYHVLSDVGRLEGVQGAQMKNGFYPLVATGFYNFAQPMINVETGLYGNLVLSPPPCSCPVCDTPMIALSDAG